MPSMRKIPQGTRPSSCVASSRAGAMRCTRLQGSDSCPGGPTPTEHLSLLLHMRLGIPLPFAGEFVVQILLGDLVQELLLARLAKLPHCVGVAVIRARRLGGGIPQIAVNRLVNRHPGWLLRLFGHRDDRRVLCLVYRTRQQFGLADFGDGHRVSHSTAFEGFPPALPGHFVAEDENRPIWIEFSVVGLRVTSLAVCVCYAAVNRNAKDSHVFRSLRS